ncbi:conserved exported protein of unknown function [Rhodovastum atsumiense]|nr:DUF2155 domain-containing protein [Rhodovastum atsumiense]CAH2604708.1 conserved exported protein of unknown function [Rhodovastum atsumiense]
MPLAVLAMVVLLAPAARAQAPQPGSGAFPFSQPRFGPAPSPAPQAPGYQAPAYQAPAYQAPVQAPPPPVAPVDVWQPRTGVELIMLDKVSARATPLAGRINEPLQYGSLTILVRSCVVRPSDAPPDAAAFLEITDSRPGPAPFRAWMILSDPSVSIFEHPVYDVRLVGCRL